MISLKTENSIIDLHRLMVNPKHFRKGIAKQLLDFIISDYKGFETIIVSTGTNNIPAVNFYLKNGFIKKEEIKIEDNLNLTIFMKSI